jgi:hypothetical protein
MAILRARWRLHLASLAETHGRPAAVTMTMPVEQLQFPCAGIYAVVAARVFNRTVGSAGDHGNAGSTRNRDRADDSFQEKVISFRRRRRVIEYNDGFRACGGELG